MKFLKVVLLVLLSIHQFCGNPISSGTETEEEITLQIYKISGTYDSDKLNASDIVRIHLEKNGESEIIIRNITEMEQNFIDDQLIYPIIELFNKTIDSLNKTEEEPVVVTESGSEEQEEEHEEEEEGEGSASGIEHDDIYVKNISQQIKSYMDFSIDPCEDFYEYACGKFENVHEIPDDETTYDTAAISVKETNLLLKRILEEDDEFTDFESMKKVKAFYSSCMDMETRNERGIRPLVDLFNMLGGWHVLRDNWDDENDFDWLTLIAQIAYFDINILFDQCIATDYDHPMIYVVSIDQLQPFPIAKSDIESNSTLLDDYAEYIAECLELLGVPAEKAVETSEDVIFFGIELSRLQVDKLNLTDYTSVVERMTIDELQRNVPGVNWKRYFKIVLQKSINASQIISVESKDFIYQLPELIMRTDPKTLANFIFWKLTEVTLPYLDDRFDVPRAKWYQASSGSKALPENWDLLLDFIIDTMHKPVSYVYIRKYFDAKSKEDSMKIAQELRRAFKETISESDMLDEPTKHEAEKKANGLHFMLGYPDDLLDIEKINSEMSDLVVFGDRCFENVLHVLRCLLNRNQRKLGQERNFDEWDIGPTIMNAFYSVTKNAVTIPAAHLQPPFYHINYPKSYIFGGIGTTIGHEITHGFDRFDRMFNSHGKIEKKWTNASEEEFERRAQCFIEQYNKYTLHGESIRGKATENENIADAGGIHISYKAYTNWVHRHGNKRQKLVGLNLSDKQIFFLSYVHGWCAIERKESAIALIKSDPHTPSKFRAIGPLQNSHEFAEAYNCPVGSPMNPEKKCVIW